MEIRPYNLAERSFSIFALLFALITFSSFLGSITASITQLRKHSTESGKQQHALRQYFSRNKVSGNLSRAIWKYLRDYHFAHQTRSHKQMDVFKFLPGHLSRRLNYELFGPYITRSPFWYHFASVGMEAVLEVCSTAIIEKTTICHEDVFIEGQNASTVYYVASGFMRYDHQVLRRRISDLSTGACLSEPALWVKWVHCATLGATTSCDIIELHTAKCRRVLQDFPKYFPFAQRYAQIFRFCMMKLGPESQTDVWSNTGAQDMMVRQAWADINSDDCGDPSVKDDVIQRALDEFGSGRHTRSTRRRTLIA